MNEFRFTDAQREALESFLAAPPATREQHDTLTQYLKELTNEHKAQYADRKCVLAWDDMRLLARVCEMQMSIEFDFEDEEELRGLKAQLHAIHPALGNLPLTAED
jgi:hypothetical protein